MDRLRAKIVCSGESLNQCMRTVILDDGTCWGGRGNCAIGRRGSMRGLHNEREAAPTSISKLWSEISSQTSMQRRSVGRHIANFWSRQEAEEQREDGTVSGPWGWAVGDLLQLWSSRASREQMPRLREHVTHFLLNWSQERKGAEQRKGMVKDEGGKEGITVRREERDGGGREEERDRWREKKKGGDIDKQIDISQHRPTILASFIILRAWSKHFLTLASILESLTIWW